MALSVRVFYVCLVMFLCAQICFSSTKIRRGKRLEYKGRQDGKMRRLSQALFRNQNLHGHKDLRRERLSVPLMRLEKQRDIQPRLTMRRPSIPKRTRNKNVQDPIISQKGERDIPLRLRFRRPVVTKRTSDGTKDVQDVSDKQKSSGLRMYGVMSVNQDRRRRRYNRNQGLVYG